MNGQELANWLNNLEQSINPLPIKTLELPSEAGAFPQPKPHISTLELEIAPSAPSAVTTPTGLCPACWARRIAAPINGPTCSCESYEWPRRNLK
jgi:hypothetical protein